ncbi:GGDEF domain-containing protein [bacterium]|nr:GGDEF domain-containing protein [bacterium]MBU1990536.1 GGDEF domain-containing protein [bacterium]
MHMDKADLEKKTKEELISLILEYQSHLRDEGIGIYNVSVLDKLKEYKSLHSHIDKIHSSSNNVGVMMFRVYNIGRSDDIYHSRISKKILDDITKLLKSKIRGTDILIKFDRQNFVIIAPNTDGEGTDKYAHKLNQLIMSNIFGNVTHLKSNFSITVFEKNDTIHMLIERLYKALIAIEKDSLKYFIKV